MGRAMGGAIAAATLCVLGGSAAAAPSVRERDGNIEYVDDAGAVRALTQGGGYGDPALSPDGRTVAFIHTDGPPPADGDEAPTSLWVADALTGKARLLLASHPSEEPKSDMAAFSHPLFSLDGGFIYVSASAWATSAAVHQVSVATGVERFVIDGGAEAVIRTGPYRGYLLVSRHMYYPPPREGSYDPVYVVRPDAKQAFPVPGTGADDGRDHLAPWLKAKGWKAW